MVYEAPIQNALDGTGNCSCVVLNCCWWGKNGIERKLPVWKWTVYIRSKYYPGSFPLLLPWYPRHLSTVVAYERLMFSWHHVTGIRLFCPNIHSTCIDLPMFIFMQTVGYLFSRHPHKVCHTRHKSFMAGSRQTTSVLLFKGLSLSSPSHWCQRCLCSSWVGQAGRLARNWP